MISHVKLESVVVYCLLVNTCCYNDGTCMNVDEVIVLEDRQGTETKVKESERARVRKEGHDDD